MIYGFLIAVIAVIVAVIGRSLTTLFHELGHAIPALLFTDDKVCVFIGSYASSEKYVNLNLGRLDIFFRFNFLDWRIGMCTHSRAKSFWNQFFIIVGGPIASFLLSIVCIWIAFGQNSSEAIKIFAVGYALLGIYDFFLNLYPAKYISPQTNGTEIYSDGFQLLRLLRQGNSSTPIQEAWEDFQDGHQSLATEKLIPIAKDSIHVKYELVKMYIEMNEFQKAFDQLKEILAKNDPTIDQFETMGDVYSGLGQKEDALKYYSTYLYHNFDNFQVKNKKAKLLFELGEEPSALKLFIHSAAQSEKNNVVAFQYIGRIYTILDDFEKALFNLKKASIIEEDAPMTYVFLAKYYEKRGKNELAIENYKKARALGSDFHGLEFKIETLK